MNSTSLSLLDRLKVARPDDPDWLSLRDLYTPLIRRWLGRVPALGAEADDLTQEILMVVAREVTRFDRRREGSFRAWLRQVTVNRVRSYRRRRGRQFGVGANPAEGFLENLADSGGALAREWDQKHDRHVFERLLALVQPDFGARTWEAFRRFALDGRPASLVAEELDLTEAAVVQAKFRILKRLRQEAGHLLE